VSGDLLAYAAQGLCRVEVELVEEEVIRMDRVEVVGIGGPMLGSP
jgi:hypothetical protein